MRKWWLLVAMGVAACGGDQTSAPDAVDPGGSPDATGTEVTQEVEGQGEVDTSTAGPDPSYGACDPERDVEGTLADNPNAMVRYGVRDAEAREALCNDGTPAIYYVAWGSGDDRDKWVIHFKGGSACGSPETCAERFMNSRQLMTSDCALHGDFIGKGGILGGDPAHNPDFASWTRVYLHYCSSDGWAGDRDASETKDCWNDPKPGGWWFKGHPIVRAIFEDLSDSAYWPEGSLADASEVLVTGSSAGAGGVRMHINWIAETLAPTPVKGVHDAGYIPDVVFGDEAGYAAKLQEALDYEGSKLDEACLASTSPGDEWLCIEPWYAKDHISVPLFVYMDQLDPVDMKRQQIDKSAQPQVEAFAQGVRDLVADEGLTGVLSPSQCTHTALTDDAGFATVVGGVSYREALARWYFDGEVIKKVEPFDATCHKATPPEQPTPLECP